MYIKRPLPYKIIVAAIALLSQTDASATPPPAAQASAKKVLVGRHTTPIATPPTVTITSSPAIVPYNSSATLIWKSVNATACNASGGWSGALPPVGSKVVSNLTKSTTFTLACSGAGGVATQSLTVTVTPQTVATVYANTRLGVNIAGICDWCNDFTFVDLTKSARGFAKPNVAWDPVGNPATVDSNGWPTQDFGVYFTTFASDPLGRPLTQTIPSFFGTYTLSFTGQAKLFSNGCNYFTNQTYNAQLNTTSAQLVVGSNCNQLDIEFNNTQRTPTSGINTGLQNVQLLRPGYALGTSQVFTTQFLNALAPFSTLRLMNFLQTNGNTVTSWAGRTLPTAPIQHSSNGAAWEYAIQLANQSGKDIWINIPEGVDLTDPTSNNYVTQLATLLKANLNPNIHVYVEYSNELWNTMFKQTSDNFNQAQLDVSSGADKTLNYDNINNPYYWGYRRIAHQTLRISQLFAAVYGPAAINTTIRPVYMNQYVQPYLAENGLHYLQQNFGSPNQYLYGVGGAPYYGLPLAYTDLDGMFVSLLAGANQAIGGFSGIPPYNGAYPLYTGITYQSLANYFGLKNISYESGPDVSRGTSAVIDEQANNDVRIKNMLQNYLQNAIGCGNSLIMLFELQGNMGDPFAIYRDFAVPSQKSAAINAVSTTPLANLNTCTASITD